MESAGMAPTGKGSVPRGSGASRRAGVGVGEMATPGWAGEMAGAMGEESVLADSGRAGAMGEESVLADSGRAAVIVAALRLIAAGRFGWLPVISGAAGPAPVLPRPPPPDSIMSRHARTTAISKRNQGCWLLRSPSSV